MCLRVHDEIRMTIDAYKTLYDSSVTFGVKKQLQAEQGMAEMEDQVTTHEVIHLQCSFAASSADDACIRGMRGVAFRRVACGSRRVLLPNPTLKGPQARISAHIYFETGQGRLNVDCTCSNVSSRCWDSRRPVYSSSIVLFHSGPHLFSCCLCLARPRFRLAVRLLGWRKTRKNWSSTCRN